jgi:hypothetical protein
MLGLLSSHGLGGLGYPYQAEKYRAMTEAVQPSSGFSQLYHLVVIELIHIASPAQQLTESSYGASKPDFVDRNVFNCRIFTFCVFYPS